MLSAGTPGGFPDPCDYDAEGLVAYGGDLGSERLVEAYSRGIFPWYGPGYVPLWWSPDPRALLTPEALHVSRSLGRTLRRGGFELRWDTRFRQVMRACGEQRTDGTWIIPEMLDAYAELHRLGFAHSLEVVRADELVGGVYGVQVGGLFAAESMFHRATDMSKVALVAMVHTLFGAGIELMDVQFATAHLASLGAFEVPRAEYLSRLAVARERVVDLRKPALLLSV
ncbi:MAG: leucyl/phenylalanyl-tRNA--protein transferase [Planctomycetes bacterium]|nr:leucyl/phenylalanyl-tRNA--protein transferase [Planctomycetota bacterium]